MIIKYNFTEDVVCSRDRTGRVVTNVPPVVYAPWVPVPKRPGFKWGADGRRQSAFAISILLLFTDEETVKSLYARFKWRYVVSLPPSGGIIKRCDIIEFLVRRAQKEGWQIEYPHPGI